MDENRGFVFFLYAFRLKKKERKKIVFRNLVCNVLCVRTLTSKQVYRHVHFI